MPDNEEWMKDVRKLNDGGGCDNQMGIYSKYNNVSKDEKEKLIEFCKNFKKNKKRPPSINEYNVKILKMRECI